MRLVDADALSENLCATTIFIKDGEVFQRMINDAPTVSAEAEWIPCSKRLPKAEYGESDCVLTTCCWKSDTKPHWIEKLYFNGGNWCYPTGEYFTQKVIAWKPMPEPYREDGEA